MEVEQQVQYREELLEWCDHLYFQWESMKPIFLKLSDPTILEDWEESYRSFKEKLQNADDVKFNDYRKAKRLYEDWNQLYREAQDFQVEMDVESENSRGIGEQQKYREELLNWCNNLYCHWESMRPTFLKNFDLRSLADWEETYYEFKEKLQTDVNMDFDAYDAAIKLYEGWDHLYRETHTYQEEMEVESEKCMDIEDQKQYRKDLLEWCNNIYYHWESMRPKFSKLFDLKSLETWEEFYRELKEKLQRDENVEFDDYHRAKSLFEHWELLYQEAHAYKELIKIESDVCNSI
ncbi:hypothetical protein ACF5W4_09190 [Bacillota bacterium Lsc_1132]